MLPKRNRVNKKGIDLIFKTGKLVISPSFTFKFIKTKFSAVQISFIVPKSVAKFAVKRNLLRRLGYRTLRKYISQFPTGIMGVFVFKKYQDNILNLENEIKNIFSKIN